MSAYEIIYYLHYYSDLITAILCFILALFVAGVLVYEIKELRKEDDEDENNRFIK